MIVTQPCLGNSVLACEVLYSDAFEGAMTPFAVWA